MGVWDWVRTNSHGTLYIIIHDRMQVLYDIPDIRLFWSQDIRFTSQFDKKRNSKKGIKFIPFSKYPACYKDISFWIPSSWHENDFMQVCRDVCGDLAEEVLLFLFHLFMHS